MAPLLISGIASVASTALDAWNQAAQRRIDVAQTKFDTAFNRAMSLSPASGATQAVNSAPSLENQLRDAPEIRGALDAQDPSRPGTLQVSSEGRVWLNVPGNQPTELTVSLETRELARQLSASLNSAAGAPRFSSVGSSAGTFAAYAR
jgi:hypothetical protein